MNPVYRMGYIAFCAGAPRDRERSIDWLGGYAAAQRERAAAGPRVTPYPWIERKRTGALALTHRPAGEVFPSVFATFEHACNVFAFLIERGERVTPLDWCERIEGRYAPHHRRERVTHAIKVCMLGSEYAELTAPAPATQEEV